MMSILSAIPVLLLVVVAVWFVWPAIADPISRLLARRKTVDDRDVIAEHLFDAWNRLGADHG